ncbi:OmpA family protein [Alysiella filiformis]|uniref:Outer membrane protein OmpA n=1 Tax=Alysiella filiformis DSM 16848 TaxID=1120981 RepID=A0A286E3U5_9NEIS|nr:OmpA family protein [Alysiella filiformis]QMT31057.1 OmpA family protein [Alysiella filiformis]UBQ55952.1 OmpA family protein [Alysiella filiformis DSM 16848]SOD65554.1 Outer membrane protein OmpA [Alysiella filiformis DSM 16848]
MKLLKSATILATAAALGLSGCVTNAQGERQLSKTATYGTLGAVTCGIIGAISHGKQGARNSAAACGVVAAGVGAYMDVQEAKLREQLANTGVEVKREGDQIKLTMPENVTFATGRYDLSAQAQNALNGAAQTLAMYNDTTLTIVGHTDNTGSDAINNPLSQNRANSVANYLNGKGVAMNRMSVVGRGSTQPIATNNTPEGRAQNRRVEILINPKAA